MSSTASSGVSVRRRAAPAVAFAAGIVTLAWVFAHRLAYLLTGHDAGHAHGYLGMLEIGAVAVAAVSLTAVVLGVRDSSGEAGGGDILKWSVRAAGVFVLVELLESRSSGGVPAEVLVLGTLIQLSVVCLSLLASRRWLGAVRLGLAAHAPRAPVTLPSRAWRVAPARRLAHAAVTGRHASRAPPAA